MRPKALMRTLAALSLTGCAAQPPATVEYLLRPAAEPAARTADVEATPVVLGSLTIAPYLDRAGIVVQTGAQRIQVAQGHRWSEPLDASIRRLLRIGIDRSPNVDVVPAGAGGDALVVDVQIHELHGTVEGQVGLVADWQIRAAGSGRVLAARELSDTRLTDESGYDALVEAHSRLLVQLAEAIAASIEAL